MPLPGKRWRHVIISTRCSWLHGDERGFRTRDHSIHSSGDYKKRPPADEHEGLRKYFEEKSGAEVHFPQQVRPTIGRAMLDWFTGAEHRILAIAVAKVHAHAVVELPHYMPKIREIVGHAKRKSSRAVKDVLPGSIWGEGGKYKLVNSKSHLKSAFEYVLYDQGADAWTWSFRDGSNDGRFGRKRPPGPKRNTSRGRAQRRPGSS